MANLFYTPAEMVGNYISAGEKKAKLPLGRMILLGILAGACIAIGGAASNVTVHGISNVGIARTLAGVVFPVGLIMVVITGAELFTGNNLMIMSRLSGKISTGALCRNLVVVYLSNLVGSLLIVGLVALSGQLDLSSGGLGAYTIKVALGKCNLIPVKALTSGILCNILVCLAILLAGAAKDIVGKIWAIFFPIFAFVTAGFEHCVANMYYIPAGMAAAMNKDYVALAEEMYGITAEQITSLYSPNVARSLLLVTLGNMIGGMIFIAVTFYVIHKQALEAAAAAAKQGTQTVRSEASPLPLIRLGIFMADGCEEIEGLTVVDVMRRAGIAIETISINGTHQITSSHNVTFHADVTKDKADYDSYDGIVLPGGMPGTLNLGADEVVNQVIQDFAESGKLVAAICAAPSVLGQANVLVGKKATCHPGFEEKLVGAKFQRQPVVVDSNIITSRGMGTAIAFALEIVRYFLGDTAVEKVKKGLVYRGVS